MPARDAFYSSLPKTAQARFLRLFKVLAETGHIRSDQHFRKIEHQGGHHLWEFKNFQERLLGDYRPPSPNRPGGRFVIAHRCKPKKRDKADPAEIERALRVLQENDAYEKGAEQ